MATTHGFQEYLMAIYILRDEGETVISARIAEFLDVSAPTVSQMIRRLERDGYLEIGKDYQLVLTPKGEEQAAATVRCHRLLERWLTDVMGLDWVQADEEAHRLQYSISPLLEERLNELLGRPQTCPHGNHIPGNGGIKPTGSPLAEAAPGSLVEVVRIREQAEDIGPLLRFLGDRGITPGAVLEVVEADPYGAGIVVCRDGHTFPVGADTASQVQVAPVSSALGRSAAAARS